MIDLSVIIPVYNAESTIERCVESVLAKNDNNVEVILINDGSTDGSGKICAILEKKYEEVKVIDIPNGGVSHARNVGLDNAIGKYIQFVDADDFVDEEMSHRLIEKAKQEHSDLVICGFKREFYRNNKLWVTNTISCPDKVIYKGKLEDSFRKLIMSGYLNPPWNKLYLREIIQPDNRFREGLSLGEDLIFNLEIVRKANKIVILSNAWYHNVEQNTDSLTRKFTYKRQEDNKTIYDAIRMFCELEGFSAETKVVNAKIFLRTNYVNLERLMGYKKNLSKNEYRNLFREITECKETTVCLKNSFRRDYECLYYKFFLKMKNQTIIELSVVIRRFLKSCIRKIRGIM